MKTNYFQSVAIIMLLLVAGSCQRQPANDADAGIGAGDDQATAGSSANAKTNASLTSSKAEVSELPGGSSVPAKRENLTATDRAAFLRALNLTKYTEDSARFLEWWNESYGTPLKNAGMTFFDLGAGRYIVETIIDQGANQSTSVYALYLETKDGQATAKSLKLDSYYSENGKVIKTTNFEKVGAPDFDSPSKTLTITAAARGIGGCGERTRYKIVGDRAEVIEARYQKCSDEMLPPEKWKLVPLKLADESKLSSDGGNGVILKDEDFQMMSPAYAAVLKRWLRLQVEMMRPLREDQTSASSQTNFRRDHPNDDPFYAVGDFNNNGTEDFAVILTYFAPRISPDTKRQLNALAIFEMSPEITNQSPKAAFFSDQIDSLFIIASRQKGQLGIASYPSDDGFLLVPQGSTYKVKPMVDF